AQRLLVSEVMIQRALRHARLVDDCVETGRLETPPMNLTEARLQETLPRPVGVTRRLHIHTDQYECSGPWCQGKRDRCPSQRPSPVANGRIAEREFIEHLDCSPMPFAALS